MKRKSKRSKEKECCRNDKKKCGACGGGAYFLGMIGSAVYYLQQSSTFGQGVVGLLKALVWPAFLVHKLLSFLG